MAVSRLVVHLDILVALAKGAVSLALTRGAEAGVRTGPHGQVRVGALAGRGIGTLIHRDQLFSHIVGLLPRVEDLELRAGVGDAGSVDSRVTDSTSVELCSATTARVLGIGGPSVRRDEIEHPLLLLLLLLLHQ